MGTDEGALQGLGSGLERVFVSVLTPRRDGSNPVAGIDAVYSVILLTPFPPVRSHGLPSLVVVLAFPLALIQVQRCS